MHFLKVFAVVALVAAQNQQDIGTVIGIDLGTTYSWCVNKTVV